ncbi:hypothetical protein Taro_038937 [Colocasia esculenta]|uniref:Uncharacterized protein n=1 Tax=Colocasia esculenta TaxID=4460 RepID=A0A843WEA4_COLES|nr:hypothetical protein [Colocasia esculenta]
MLRECSGRDVDGPARAELQILRIGRLHSGLADLLGNPRNIGPLGSGRTVNAGRDAPPRGATDPCAREDAERQSRRTSLHLTNRLAPPRKPCLTSLRRLVLRAHSALLASHADQDLRGRPPANPVMTRGPILTFSSRVGSLPLNSIGRLAL